MATIFSSMLLTIQSPIFDLGAALRSKVICFVGKIEYMLCINIQLKVECASCRYDTSAVQVTTPSSSVC